jgi:hypothetical protein
MTEPVFPNVQSLNRFWARAMVNMAWTQWGFLTAGLRFANRMMQPPWATPAGAGPPPSRPAEAGAPRVSGGGEDLLTRLAAERLAAGLAPPPEIYQVPYRNQIDWSQFPEWARPSDPDLYEGCGHEG